MKSGDKKLRRTVVLATDAGGCSDATVGLAVDIARLIKSRLRGVFIEDEDLLRLSRLPFAREISLTTAEARPLEIERIERAMRAAARQFRQVLEREAHGLKAGWSFDLVRGRLAEIGLRSREEAVCVIVSRAQTRSRATSERAPRRILLVAGDSRHQAKALKGIVQSLVSQRVEVTLIDGDAASGLATTLGKLADASPGLVEITELPRERLPELMRERGASFDYAIVAQRENADDLALLLARLRCPLLLVA